MKVSLKLAGKLLDKAEKYKNQDAVNELIYDLLKVKYDNLVKIEKEAPKKKEEKFEVQATTITTPTIKKTELTSQTTAAILEKPKEKPVEKKEEKKKEPEKKVEEKKLETKVVLPAKAVKKEETTVEKIRSSEAFTLDDAITETDNSLKTGVEIKAYLTSSDLKSYKEKYKKEISNSSITIKGTISEEMGTGEILIYVKKVTEK